MTAALRTYEQYEKKQLQVQQLLKTTGYAAGLTADDLREQASAVALATLASVDGIAEAQSILLTFKSVSGDTFKQAIVLSQDMAAVFGGTAKDKALQLGKALESPTEGLTALKRSGVSFTEQQKDQITALDAAGNRAEAQRLIFQELQNQIGGAGAASAGGLSGSVDTLSQRWDEFKIALVSSTEANSVAGGLLNTLANGLDRVNNAMAPKGQDEFDQLFARRQEILAEMKQLGSGEKTGVMSWLVGNKSELMNLNSEYDRVMARLSELQELRKKQQTEQTAAQLASEQKQREISEAAKAEADKKLAEKEAERLAKQKTADEAAIASVRRSLADKQQVEDIAMAERQDKIDQAWLNQNLSEEEWQNLTAQNFALYQQRLADIAKTGAEKRVEEDKRAADLQQRQREQDIAALSNFNSTTLSALESVGKKRSSLYKAMFAAQKMAAIPSMIASTEEGATAALKLGPVAGPIGAGIVRGLGYASIGVVAGTTIAGSYENGGIIPGSSYTGDNLTAAVNSREMVLNMDQQKQLFDIANGSAVQARGNQIVNIYEDASKAGSVERQAMGNDEIVNVFVSNVRSGGEIATEMEQTWPQLSRKGRF